MSNKFQSAIISGQSNYTRSLLFEIAIYWAEKGHRVLYISPLKIQRIPKSHETSEPTEHVYEKIRFLYITNYEKLVEELVDINIYSVIPSVVLIETIDHFTREVAEKESDEMVLAKMYATIVHSMNVCGKILKNTEVFFCGTIENLPEEYQLVAALYFDKLWGISEENETVCLQMLDNTKDEIYRYQKSQNEMIQIKQIVKIVTN